MQKQKTADDKTPDAKKEVGGPIPNDRAAAAAADARTLLKEMRQKEADDKEKGRRRGCCGCC